MNDVSIQTELSKAFEYACLQSIDRPEDMRSGKHFGQHKGFSYFSKRVDDEEENEV